MDHQKALLKKVNTWYMDGTFKLVREPFKQLYSIHDFITNGTVTKQVPLLFVLMSGQSVDYRSISRLLKEKIGELSVEKVVMDFEKASWKAALLEFPDVRRRGFTFHWTHAVWKNVLPNCLTNSHLHEEAPRTPHATIREHFCSLSPSY